MIKILEILPNATDGTSFYRGRGPNSLLEKTYRGEFQFIPVDPNRAIEWDNLLKVDMVFMQRPIYDVHVKTAERCRRMGIPLWIDYDDLLTEVPPDNTFHGQYEAFKHNVKLLLDYADMTSVSTPFLGERLADIGGNKFVTIPNALHPMFGLPNIESMNEGVFWRGSPLHLRDLMEVSDTLGLIQEETGFHLTMMGYAPWFFKNSGIKYDHAPYGDLLDYYGLLAKRQWNICIVPLHDSNFNRSKSNIAFLEACYAGAMTIAPDFEEWRKPGIINYKDAQDLGEIIKMYHKSPELVNKVWREGSEYVINNLLLKDVNIIRKGIIKLLAAM